MSDTERIENVLRRAPKVKTPAGLAQKLKTDISLPHASATASATDFWAGFRRWFPGFATAALFLTCLVALGVQQRVLSGLRHEQKQLEAAAAETRQVAEANRAEQEQAQAQTAQLAQLRKDNAELQQLRAAVAQLREQLQQLPALRAERAGLVAQAKAMESRLADAHSDPLAVAQDKARRIQCVSNMKQIGLAARMWANDHKEIMPSDFLTMQNELNSPRILVCPSETNRPVPKAWSEFSGSSYVILSLGTGVRRPEIIYAHCPVHNNIGLCDGSVHQLSHNQPIVKDETGHWIVKPRQ
jgi:hypothetical protein